MKVFNCCLILTIIIMVSFNCNFFSSNKSEKREVITTPTLMPSVTIKPNITPTVIPVTPFKTATPVVTSTPLPSTPSSTVTPIELCNKIADHTVINTLRFGKIPQKAVEDAIKRLKIAYGHTSHGSQLTEGMEGVSKFC